MEDGRVATEERDGGDLGEINQNEVVLVVVYKLISLM